jgi:tetrahydromethanopterin S-methyltransferase subunit E
MPYIPVDRTYLMVIFASMRPVTFTVIHNFCMQFLHTLIFLCLLSPYSLPHVAVVAVRLYVGGADSSGMREDYAVRVIYSDTCGLLRHFHYTY